MNQTKVISGGTLTFNGFTEYEWELINTIAVKTAILLNRPVWQKIPEYAEVLDAEVFLDRCKLNYYLENEELAFWATSRVYSNVSAFAPISNRPPMAHKVVIL